MAEEKTKTATPAKEEKGEFTMHFMTKEEIIAKQHEAVLE